MHVISKVKNLSSCDDYLAVYNGVCHRPCYSTKIFLIDISCYLRYHNIEKDLAMSC